MSSIFAGFFQFGYVTRDLDAAMAFYKRRFGAIDFFVTDPPPVDGVVAPTRRLALTYIDDVMTEIIEPDPAQATIFDDALPAEAGVIRLHHLGFLVDSHEDTMRKLEALDYVIALYGSIPGALDYSYADARGDLGHYLEFIRLDAGGRAMFDAVPRLRKSGARA